MSTRVTRFLPWLLASVAVGVAGCGQGNQPAGQAQTAAPSEPSFQEFGDFQVHYNAVRTDELTNHPRNTRVQDEQFGGPRGPIFAGNLVDCALGLLAVGFQYAMMLVIPPSWQFVVMGILSLFMAWAVFRFSRAASGSR